MPLALLARVRCGGSASHRRSSPETCRSFPCTTPPSSSQAEEKLALGGGYHDGDLVFCRTDGDSIHPDLFSQTFDRAVVKSGLPQITLHDLRHTHATLLLKAGVPVKVVSERLGHSNPGFTMSVYQHVIPGMQAEAAAVFSNLVAKPGAPTDR